MRRAIRWILLGLICLAFLPTGPAAAPQPVNLINGIGLIDYTRKPDFKVGSWAKYHVTGSSEMGMSDDYVVTVLIAGEEKFWGEDGFWVETWTEPKGKPPWAVATLMSYEIFNDDMPLVRMQLYSRKMINEVTTDGQPVQTIAKRPSSSLTMRKPVADKSAVVTDTLGKETITVPRGSFPCTKVVIRHGVGATADMADSSVRTDVYETRTVFMNRQIPITSVAREEIENLIQRKSWKIGHSQDAPLNTMDKAKGVAELIDYGSGGLKPELVPEAFRRSLAEQQASPKPKSTAKAPKKRTG
jgi:hypothetical protein